MSTKKVFLWILLGLIAVGIPVFVVAGGFKDPRQKGTLVFWTPRFVEDETTEWFEHWIDEYNATNEVGNYVDLVLVPEDTWDQQLTAARSSNNAPDLVMANYAAVPLEGQSGYHTDLTPLFNQAVWDDILPYVDSMINVNGKRYIYPAFVEPYSVLFYSKSKFTAAGLDPEKPPETWDELVSYAEKLTKNGTYGIQIPPAGQMGWVLWGFQGMAGQELLNDNWDAANGDTEFNRKLFSMSRTLYQNGWSPKSSQFTYNEINQFALGNVAMQPCGSWGIGQIKNNFPEILPDVGVAKFPSPDGSDGSTAALGGWGMTISTDCKNTELAADFMQYLLAGDEEIMVDFFTRHGYSKFPGRKSVENALNADEDANADPYRSYIAEEILPQSVSEPCYPWAFSDTFATRLQTYMTDASSNLDTVMASLQRQLENYINSEETAGKNPRKGG